jgi:hypothetical protein
MSILHKIESDPIPLYQTFLLTHLAKVYAARKQTTRTDWRKYSDYLIEKFAIHSSTLFHLIDGIIEHHTSDLKTRKVSFDLFSINSLIRVLIETYITFNHIFVYAKSEEEKEFRFLLWQLDGLLEQKKFKIDNNDFEEAQSILEANSIKIANLFKQIETSKFNELLDKTDALKILNKEKAKVNWKFKIREDSVIIPLKIIELVEFTCVSRIFVNTYKYTSTHTHSGFVSIEHFEKMRGKQVSDDYVNPFVTQAIILTIFLINDICLIDSNVRNAFYAFSENDKQDIIGINKAFRKL